MFPFRGRGRGRFNRGGFSRGYGRKNLQTKSLARRENNGKTFRPSHIPPSIVDNPWNTVVLPIKGAGCLCLTCSSAASSLKTYLNIATFTGNYVLCLRFIRVKVWIEKTVTHPLSKSASVRYFNVMTGENFSSEVTMVPGDVSYMSSGYEWPRSCQNAVYDVNSADSDVLSIVAEDTSADYIIHLHLLWRIEQPCACPSYVGQIRTLENSVKDLTDKFQRFDCSWDQN